MRLIKVLTVLMVFTGFVMLLVLADHIDRENGIRPGDAWSSPCCSADTCAKEGHHARSN